MEDGWREGEHLVVHDAATRNSEQEVRENFLEAMRRESEIRGFGFAKF